MRENDHGQYLETLGNQLSFRIDACSEVSIYKVGDTRPPTLVEVMLDPEFLVEFRGGNECLFKFLDIEKMLQVADYVI